MAVLALNEDTHRKISFRINEIGKPTVVLRLYIVKGVVSPGTPVMADYKHPVFNLDVVAQRKRGTRGKGRNTQNSPYYLPVPFPYVPLLSALFQGFSA